MGVLAVHNAPAEPAPKRPSPLQNSSSSAVVMRQPTNLLGEALGFDNHGTAPSRLGRSRFLSGANGGFAAPSGMPVSSVPVDWAPKRSCSISSLRSLEWCVAQSAAIDGEAMRAANLGNAVELVRPGAAHASTSSTSNTELDVVTEHALGIRLRAALMSWRHPAQRLPPLVSKQLAGVDVGPAEVAYSRMMRESWQAALRSLYFDLREGRLPYFYAHNDSFTLLWRNGAIPVSVAALREQAVAATIVGTGTNSTGTVTAHEDAAGGANSSMSASACSNETSDGAPSIWEYLLRGGSHASYAVLAPSHRGLRMQLRAAGVPFEMPRAHLVNVEGASALEPSPPGERYLAELRELNFGHNISEHARSASRGADSVPASSLWEREMILERWLSSVDGKAASVLLFRGTASLHALYDFLQAGRHTYHLSVQFLSPAPFLHGAPHAPRIHYRGTVRVAGGTLNEVRHRVDIDCADRSVGGLASGGLLPGSIQRIAQIFREAQGGEFELLSQPLDKHGSFLNLPPPPAANPPAQPLTCLVLQKDERSVLPMLQPAHSHTVQPAENGRSEISPRELVPTTVGKVVCVRGALYVDG